MLYELKKAFETIEPADLERQTMLKNIIAKSGKTAQKNKSSARRFMPAAAVMALVICVGIAGAYLLPGQQGSYLPEAAAGFTAPVKPPDLHEIMASLNISEDKELITVSYNGVRELSLSPINDILIIRSADIDEVQISFFDTEISAMLLDGSLKPNDLDEDFSLINEVDYLVDAAFTANRSVHFSSNISNENFEDRVSAVFVTLPKNAPLHMLYINANNTVWIEDVTADRLLVGKPDEWKRDYEFVLTIIDSHFGGTSVIGSNTHVHAVRSTFNGTSSNTIGAIGFYYAIEDNTERRSLYFKDCEATGIWTMGDNIALMLEDCDVGSVGAVGSGSLETNYEGLEVSVSGSKVEDLHISDTKHTHFIANSKIKYLHVGGEVTHRDDVILDERNGDYILNNVRIINSELESFTIWEGGFAEGYYNILTGDIQLYSIPANATRSTTSFE
jgi:hypothetical protein